MSARRRTCATVRQYFQNSRAMDAKTLELVARIVDVEFIVTDTEVEALDPRIEPDQAPQAALQRDAQG